MSITQEDAERMAKLRNALGGTAYRHMLRTGHGDDGQLSEREIERAEAAYHELQELRERYGLCAECGHSPADCYCRRDVGDVAGALFGRPSS